jgi:succinylarginine dihydrolase
MSNGGGPACLRLRVVLTESEYKAVNPSCLLTTDTYAALMAWSEKHYREELLETDLADPKLLIESRYALDELTQLLNIGSVYDFQI